MKCNIPASWPSVCSQDITQLNGFNSFLIGPARKRIGGFLARVDDVGNTLGKQSQTLQPGNNGREAKSFDTPSIDTKHSGEQSQVKERAFIKKQPILFKKLEMGDSWEDNTEEKFLLKPTQDASASQESLDPGAREWTPNADASAWEPSWLKAGSSNVAISHPAEETSISSSGASPAAGKDQANVQGMKDMKISEVGELKSTKDPLEGKKGSNDKDKYESIEQNNDTKETSEDNKASLNKNCEDSKEEEEEVNLAEQEAAALRELPDPDPREHLNVVFIGHVDAGKSTLSGSILYAMGAVDKRTIEKYEKEAKERNRESWFLAFIMDTNEEERQKGKTVEVGRAEFATENKRYTILDAPGHKNYVPAMISGASQADVGILVISARKGEFEAGFDRLGQTREHALLAKTLGVQKLIVVINKMDEVTVQWSKERYDECVKRLTPFLKRCGFRVKRDVVFIPISALTGDNVKRPVKAETCEWATHINENRSLVDTLDQLTMSGRDSTAPLRIPVLDRYIDRGGLIVLGKVDSGNVRTGQKVQMNPNSLTCTVDSIYINETEVQFALVGENIKLKLKGIEENDINKGFVISDTKRPAPSCKMFVAQLHVLDLLEHRSLFTAGYNCVLHVHTAIEECTIKSLLREMDMSTGKPKNTRPRFVKSQSGVWCRIEVEQALCVEPFKDMMPLGRFTLRDEGKTIAIGKVIRLD